MASKQQPWDSQFAQRYRVLLPCYYVVLLELRVVLTVMLNYSDPRPQERTVINNEVVQDCPNNTGTGLPLCAASGRANRF